MFTPGGCICFGSVSSFFLQLFLHWSPVAYWAPTFHTVHGVLKARILKWFATPFSSGPHFVRTLHYDPPILGGCTGMAHSFCGYCTFLPIWYISKWLLISVSFYISCSFLYIKVVNNNSFCFYSFKVKVVQSCPTPCDHMDGSLLSMGFSRQEY